MGRSSLPRKRVGEPTRGRVAFQDEHPFSLSAEERGAREPPDPGTDHDNIISRLQLGTGIRHASHRDSFIRLGGSDRVWIDPGG